MREDMLTRDMENAMFCGVCSGVAKHLSLDVSIVRLVTVLSFLFTGSLTFWAYIVAAILLPKE